MYAFSLGCLLLTSSGTSFSLMYVLKIRRFFPVSYRILFHNCGPNEDIEDYYSKVGYLYMGLQYFLRFYFQKSNMNLSIQIFTIRNFNFATLKNNIIKL